MKLFAYIKQIWSELKEPQIEDEALSEARFNAAQQMIASSAYKNALASQQEGSSLELPPTEAEVWNKAIDAVLDKLQSGWWTIDEIRGMKR